MRLITVKLAIKQQPQTASAYAYWLPENVGNADFKWLPKRIAKVEFETQPKITTLWTPADVTVPEWFAKKEGLI
jgi:hypothetical protein